MGFTPKVTQAFLLPQLVVFFSTSVSDFSAKSSICLNWSWIVDQMCHQNYCELLSAEEATAGEERLLIYCKPVELYNILRHRAQLNPSYLRRCLHYKIRAKHKRRLRPGIVVFNYRDYTNMLTKTEVTEDFSCPFCLMQCACFKVDNDGLRYHLCSSHDLFNYEFWVTDDYQAVNISVKIDTLTSEIVAGGVDPRLQTFFFCAKPRSRKRKNLAEHEKQVNIQFLELDSPGLPTDDANGEFAAKDDGERDSKLSPSGRKLPNGRDGGITSGFNGADCIEGVASSFNGPDVPIAMAQSSMDPECVKSLSGTDAVAPAMLHVVKSRKLSTERSDPRNRALLSKRQFYHSHRVQPMAIEQVTSNEDSEDEVDDDIADFEDRRMLDDFVDVSKDEKQLMHLWNSFVRKQRVLADGHVPWACEAFSKLHGRELVLSPALFWCWRLFMIKLWNHGLLDGCTMNNCNMILEKCRDEESDTGKS
ncbi:polycomb group protein EMBRYONIC FLOWER 2 isoform X1 [Citrus sinensis]|uniref:polycomb group protein EMBRYONIC FLOWER 2 isoform X2 n=2 Tax=Citrus TaxID=2706 RepID=UPI000CED6FF3|nr:polycomb group protein EMBRYONIC FLOWER 2 isoform X2 [Citrus x clementina]XP_052293295.1 polycomb group protein EMBRYONIC FLOWER 2 isoform X1 [Citrus sinensis]